MDIQLGGSKAEIMTCIFQHIRQFTDNLSLIFRPGGVYFQTMDSARVSIVELTLPSGWFDVYSFGHKGDIVLGLNTAIFFKILNVREKQQKIQMVYEKDDSFAIHFTSDDKTVFDKHFVCPLVDLDSEAMVIPDTDYTAEFTLPSTTFSTLIQQLKTFGDTMDIDCTEEKIQMAAKSSESGAMSVDVPIDDLNSFAINEGEQLNMSFSLGFLNNICAFSKTAKEVSVRLCNEYPLSVIYPITEEDAQLRIYLAPKMSDD